ncbi:hypothetical protein ACFQ9X_32235 [Catenulispora yoronensis]
MRRDRTTAQRALHPGTRLPHRPAPGLPHHLDRAAPRLRRVPRAGLVRRARTGRLDPDAPGTPGAIEDLNRLVTEAVWDLAARRYRERGDIPQPDPRLPPGDDLVGEGG